MATIVIGLIPHYTGMARRANPGAKFARDLPERSRPDGLGGLQPSAGDQAATTTRVSGEVSSPMIVGARTPVLLLPEGFARHTENEIRAALCHELAHIQRQDYLVNVACQVAALPLAWHPVVDWVQQRIQMTREMVCDAMAAQEMKSHLGYAKCLLALAHSMLGGRDMAAQTQFLGLFGNHTLEERVMRLMDTTTMSLRAKTARVVSGAAMMIATGVIAGCFIVTPTMAQANVPPQATQNPPAELPRLLCRSLSLLRPQLHTATSPLTPKKHTYVHRNRGDGKPRISLTEQPLIDKDVQQQINDLARQMAEAKAKLNSPEFKQRMEDAQRQMAEATAKFEQSRSSSSGWTIWETNGRGSGKDKQSGVQAADGRSAETNGGRYRKRKQS